MRNRQMVEDYGKITDALDNFYKYCYYETIFDVVNKHYNDNLGYTDKVNELRNNKKDYLERKLILIRNDDFKCDIHDFLKTIEEYISLVGINGYVDCKYFLINSILGKNEND